MALFAMLFGDLEDLLGIFQAQIKPPIFSYRLLDFLGGFIFTQPTPERSERKAAFFSGGQ